MRDIRKDLAAIFGRAKMDPTTHSSDQLAGTLLAELGKRGIAIVDQDEVIDPPDEHLSTMKRMKRRINEAINDPDCAARDLASLSRRLIEIQRDITTMEERIRQENKQRGRTSRSNETTSHDAEFDPANI